MSRSRSMQARLRKIAPPPKRGSGQGAYTESEFESLPDDMREEGGFFLLPDTISDVDLLARVKKNQSNLLAQAAKDLEEDTDKTKALLH